MLPSVIDAGARYATGARLRFATVLSSAHALTAPLLAA
jgi:hypothetical protein